MKENFLQILLYLFKHHDIKGVLQSCDNEGLLAALRHVGLDLQEVCTAIEWLCGFKQVEQAVKNVASPTGTSMRVFTESETKKLDTEVRGFIHLFEQTGLLDNAKRELIIERAMSSESQRIFLHDLHFIINVILSEGKPQDTATRNAYFLLLLPTRNPH